MGHSSATSRCAQCNGKGPHNGIARILKEGHREIGDRTTTAEDGVMHFEDGRGGHAPQNTGSLEELRKARKRILSPEPPEGTQPCWHLDFSSIRPVLDFFPLQNQ